MSLGPVFDPVAWRALCWIGAASGRRKSEEPPLLLPIVRQIPGEHDEPCGRQLDGLLADQDRANDFRREIRETHEHRHNRASRRAATPLSRRQCRSPAAHPFQPGEGLRRSTGRNAGSLPSLAHDAGPLELCLQQRDRASVSERENLATRAVVRRKQKISSLPSTQSG